MRLSTTILVYCSAGGLTSLVGNLSELEHDWMLYRLEASPRLRKFIPVARQRAAALLLRTICRLRTGLVLRIQKVA